MDVKQKEGVITHKNVFVPRHVLFLGLMYSFFLGGGGQNLCCIFLLVY